MKLRFFEKTDDARVPPGQSLARGFPVLTYGPTPRIAKERVELRVSGLATPRTFDWEALLALPQTSVRRDFHCVTHWSKLDVGWTGVLTTDLVRALDVAAAASHVMLRCYGGYTTNLSLEDFLAQGCLIAHRLEGEDIPAEHGGPLRAVIPHLYAWKSAKWLAELHFMRENEPGFWERNGYHMRGDPFAEERFG
ncbi:MAG: sulfite oxidase-like oxidoreductase [Deinococcales bacterium]|jgi:DMSO/TMAO reductase YedYZ molybdopterin-dependent catalytic subunit